MNSSKDGLLSPKGDIGEMMIYFSPLHSPSSLPKVAIRPPKVPLLPLENLNQNSSTTLLKKPKAKVVRK